MRLTGELMVQGEATVAHLVAHLANEGHVLEGRPSKVISDALRWEITNGRVTRVGRGRYRYVGAPPTTERRIRRFVARAQAWISAVASGETPPPTLPDPRDEPQPTDVAYIDSAPWHRLGWLWGR